MSKKKKPFKHIKIGFVAFAKDGKPVRTEPVDVTTKKSPKRKSA